MLNFIKRLLGRKQPQPKPQPITRLTLENGDVAVVELTQTCEDRDKKRYDIRYIAHFVVVDADKLKAEFDDVSDALAWGFAETALKLRNYITTAELEEYDNEPYWPSVVYAVLDAATDALQHLGIAVVVKLVSKARKPAEEPFTLETHQEKTWHRPIL